MKNISLNKLKINSKINYNIKIFNNYQSDLLNNSEFDDIQTSYLSDSINASFAISKYNQFESYLSILNLFNIENTFQKYKNKYTYSLLTKFTPFLIKNGLKLKTINNILHSFSNIYKSLNYKNSFTEYAFINEFKYYILTSKNTNNINYLLNWIVTIYKPVFDIKAFNVPKTTKKKNDKIILFKIAYVTDKNRLKVAYKHLASDIKKNVSNKFNVRLSKSILDILLNYKKSYLYTRKMYIYEQVMDL